MLVRHEAAAAAAAIAAVLVRQSRFETCLEAKMATRVGGGMGGWQRAKEKARSLAPDPWLLQPPD